MDITRWWISLNDFWRRIFSIHIALHTGGNSYDRILENIESPFGEDISIIYKNIYNTTFEQPSLIDSEKVLSLQYFYLRPQQYLDVPDEEGNCAILYKDIPDIKPLNQLTQLEIIDISCNFIISDLTPISNCSNLKILKCGSNKIQTIQPLQHANNLIELDISNNNITNLVPIQSKSWLRYLDCGGNPLETLKFLTNLKNLEYLKCSNLSGGQSIELEELNYLTNLKKLKELHLYNFRLHNELDLESILGNEPMEKLQTLLPNCQITY